MRSGDKEEEEEKGACPCNSCISIPTFTPSCTYCTMFETINGSTNNLSPRIQISPEETDRQTARPGWPCKRKHVLYLAEPTTLYCK